MIHKLQCSNHFGTSEWYQRVYECDYDIVLFVYNKRFIKFNFMMIYVQHTINCDRINEIIAIFCILDAQIRIFCIG